MTEVTVFRNPLTMSSREIADLVGSRHDNVKRTIERLAESDVIQLPPLEEAENINNLGFAQKSLCYVFAGEKGKRDSIVVVAQLSPEFTARLVDRWQELEAKDLAAIPRTYAEALRLAADLEEQKTLALAERDAAVATKALIGSRREATAMNAASQAAKLANKLKVELDRSHEYATIKRMQMLFHGQKFDWHLLKNTAAEMGVETIDVFDQNYGTVKAYHASVWREAYALEIQQPQEAA